MAEIDEKLPECFEGEFNGKHLRILREVCQHRFTDEEVEALLAGKTIMFRATKRDGGEFNATAFIGQNDKGYWGVVFDFTRKPDIIFSMKPWCGHEFTREELDRLIAGERVNGHFTWKSGKDSDADVIFTYEERGTFKGWCIKPCFDD